MIDLQSELQDPSNPVLNKVGIKHLKLPVQVITAPGKTQPTIANFNAAIQLPGEQRATHMSRFVEILHAQSWTLSIPSLAEMLTLVSSKFNCSHAYITADFTIFKTKQAPITKTPSLLDYQITMSASKAKQNCEFIVTVNVPVTCLCPCSKAISEVGAHNQRALITVAAAVTREDFDLDKLIEIIEQQGSCALYSTLKRPDEKFVTEHAYHNAKFVEDIARDVAKQLADLPVLTIKNIYVESFESIHNHSAYAEINNN